MGQFPIPHAPRTGLTSKGLIGIVAGVVVVIVTASVVFFSSQMPEPLPDPHHGTATATTKESSSPDKVETLVRAINEALHKKDRNAFMARFSGDAVAPLNLWWDNMDAIGWETAGLSVHDPLLKIPSVEKGAHKEISMTLGAVMGFTAYAPRGSGTKDAGKKFIQGSYYKTTVSNPDGELLITSWEPLHAPVPWDLDKLYVARGKNSVVAGVEAEKSLVDSTVVHADNAAQWIIDTYAQAGRELPLKGFNTFTTGDTAKYDEWTHQDDGWLMETAGFTKPTKRPSSVLVGLDPVIATGSLSSTAFVATGPHSASQLDETLVHEYAHVAHYTDSPSQVGEVAPRAVVEGWAEYLELCFANGTNNYPGRGTQDGQYIRLSIDRALHTIGEFPTTEQVYGADASYYYLLSSTIYAYAAALGYDVFQLSSAAKMQEESPFTVSAQFEGHEPLTSAGWKAWVQANY